MKQSPPVTDMTAVNQELKKVNSELSFAETQCKIELQEGFIRRIENINRDWLTAFDAVPDPIFMHDGQFNITRVNKAYAEKAGLQFKEIIGRPYWDVFPKRTGPLPTCLTACKSSQQGDGHEEEFQLDTGEIYLSRASHAFDCDGDYQYSIHFLQDITQHKQATLALLESEDKFCQICGSAQDAILMMDNDGCLSYWNPAAEKILGYTFAEVQGKDMHQLLAPARFFDAYTKGFAHFRGTGEGAAIGKTLELVATRKDGKEFPIELSVAGVNIDGKWNAIGIMRDITERTRMQQTLKDSEQRFRSVVETVPDALYQVSLPEFATTYVSPAISNLLGFLPEDYLEDRQLWIKQLHDEDRERIIQAFKAAIEQKTTQLQHEYRAWHKNGQDLRWLQNHVSISYDNHEMATVMVGSLTDITELKRIQNDLQRTSRTLKTLSYCNTTLVHATEEISLLQAMCHIVVDIGGYRGAWVGYAQHDKAKTLLPMAQSGLTAGYIEEFNPTWANVGFGISPSGKAVRTGKKQIVQHVQDLANIPDAGWCSAEIQLGVASIIALPLMDGNKILGNLSIYSTEPEGFDQQEVAMLQELADDLAFGISTLRTRIEHRKSIEEQQQYLDKIRTTLEATIQAIAATVEMRDPYTAGHERRVAELAVAIAKEMGLSDHQIEGIRVAATVHDLGKIQIPAEILSKPSSLSDIEFTFIKVHPLMGYNILKDIDFPWPVAEIVLQHHERIDGSGYPNGLKGKHILLEARIIAVADTVEAMASHRPYRAGLGIRAALDEITASSGKHYDPKVVEACVKLFREKGFSLNN